MASMYAVYHGREGLELIAQRVHRLTAILAAGLRDGGLELVHDAFFDTIRVRVPHHADAVIAAARQLGINLLRVDADTVGISCDEVTERPQVEALWSAFRVQGDIEALDAETPRRDPAGARAHEPTSSRTRSSARTAPRRRCCATCARSRAATSRSTAR